MNSLVSVIIPSYNREKTIVRAVESVLKQTYPNIEIIVVDDCSTDNTIEILKDKYSNNRRIKIEQLSVNSGACVARNKGISLSKGAYIAFLDSDDEFYPDKIQKQINQLKLTNADLCVSDYDRINQKGYKKTVLVKEGTGEKLYNDLLFCNFITTGTLLGKGECFRVEKFDEELPRYQDWELVLRLCRKYQFCMLHEATMLQEFQPQSITSSTSHKKTFEAMTIIYKKNEDGFEKNIQAKTQFRWLMGYHSMYIDGIKNYSFLWQGVVGNGFNLKRMIIYGAFKLGFASKIEKFFIQ